MVDQIGVRPVSAGPLSRGVTAAADVRAATSPQAATAAPAKTAEPSGAATLARTLAASPPVDMDRVAVIKLAIANGTFPIAPAQIADQFIALKLAWNSNETA